MLELGVIYKSLFDMDQVELDISVSHILAHPQFVKKNTVGNNMYSNSLKHYRYYINAVAEMSNENIDIERLNLDRVTISATEKEAVIQARIGQGQYRRNLLGKYERRCIVTGVDNEKLLMASHIKPWSVSSNQERIDCENGLLLSANMDKLFDCGLISFSKKGRLLVSKLLGKENERRLNLSGTIDVDLKASSRLLNYLDYHRDVIFV
jgi:predicted restriction endonuclease